MRAHVTIGRAGVLDGVVAYPRLPQDMCDIRTDEVLVVRAVGTRPAQVRCMLDHEPRPWRIDITDEAEVARWAHTFGVTRERLRHAVFAVGTLIGQLRAFLLAEPQFAY